MLQRQSRSLGRKTRYYGLIPLGMAVSLALHAEEDVGKGKSPWELIGWSAALDRGLTGANVGVAVLDEGFFDGHPTYTSKFVQSLINQYIDSSGKLQTLNPLVPVYEEEDDSITLVDHGLSVSSVIAGSAVKDFPGGVAQGVNLFQVPVETTYVTDEDYVASVSGALKAVQREASGVRISNLSSNFDSIGEDAGSVDQSYAENKPDFQRLTSDLLDHVRDDRLFVVAAGNESKQQPGVLAALPRFESALEQYFLSVVAVDGQGALETYSNHCGVSKNWCLAAPGTLSVPNAGFDEDGDIEFDVEVASGTSLAAPLVSASAALLAERFPYFDIPQIRMTLLTTATDLGAPGVDSTYGWGLLNVEKAIDGPGQLFGDQRVFMNAAQGGRHASDFWSNDIVAGGRLTKAGTGQLGLAGNNHIDGITVENGRLLLTGSNTFNRESRVDAGELLVIGSLSGPRLQVGRAGLLNGWGEIAAATRIEGTLETGVFGAPVFTRELTLANGSTTRVETGQGHAVRLKGPEALAQLGGTLQVTGSSARPVVGDQWLLRTIDGARVQGGFDALQQLQGLREQGLRHDLLFGQSGVALTLGSVSLPTQERQRGNALQTTLALNALRDQPIALRAGAYNDWLQASLRSGSLGGLERTAGGQVYADGLSYLSRQSSTLDRLMFRELGQPLAGQGSHVWLSNLTSSQRNGQRQGIQSSSEHNDGVLIGVTHSVSENTQAAASLAVSEARVNSSGGKLQLDTVQLAVGVQHAFARFDDGPYVGANLTSGHAETTGKRKQSGFGTAKGEGIANQYSAALRSGYRWNIDGLALEPYTGLSMATTSTSNVREKGSELGLNVKGQTQTRTSLVSGVKASRNVQVNDWLLTPELELGHNRTLSGAVARSQSELQGVRFDQYSANAGRDSFTAGLAISASRGAFKTTLDVQGAKGGRSSNSGAGLTVGYRF